MFIDNLEDALNNSITENGAAGYKTTKSALVDFNFKIASYRQKPENEIENDFIQVWNEDKELALKFLFYIRDAREGVGERALFRTCIKLISNELDNRVFDWIEEYGRLDDLFALYDTSLKSELIMWIKNKLTADMLNAKENKPISLLGKWMPSINTSSKETRKLAKSIIKDLDINEKEYRKMLSGLRKASNILEPKLCKNEWSNVDYEAVPSQANLKYNSAFLRHDETRRREYLGALSKGEVKINSSVTFPHDIVNKYGVDNWVKPKIDEALEGMWKALPDYIKGQSNIMVVRDGSGSMTSPVSGKVTALDVSTALSIYFSERSSGQFKDKFITFSSNPEFVDLSKFTTLRDKLVKCAQFSDCSNTDLEKTFDLILNVAIKNKLRQEEIPALLIISDMEFDAAHLSLEQAFNQWRINGHLKEIDDDKLFNVIETKYKNAGYELPKLVFWNVNSRTCTIPVTENKNGVILVSGFSAAISKMVLSDKLDPYAALIDIITSNRYKQITLKRD